MTVVIPAYNAGSMIVETLQSVSAQTYRDLEILVVDDGSSDDTAEIIGGYAVDEPRLRLIRQANGGVAAARNTGIAQAAAPLIAPLDSDDLWHPTRIEKHVAALERSPTCSFVYSPSRIMNSDGHVIGNHPTFAFEGRVFYRQLFYNMVGNGSGMMFRRDAALAVGGYDCGLRDVGLQGCEDWLFQMLLSVDAEVAYVPEYLIGYRKVPGAMSADASRMWRSRIVAADKLRERVSPEAWPLIDLAKQNFSTRLALQSLRKTDPRQLVGAVTASVQRGRIDQVVGEFGEVFVRARRAKARRAPPGPHFLEYDPKTPGYDDFSDYTRTLIAELKQADEALAVGGLGGAAQTVARPEQRFMHRFAGRAGYALALRGAWAVANFAGAALLARWLSAHDYGNYAKIISLVTFLSIVCALGAPYALVRMLAEFGGDDPTAQQASSAKGALVVAHGGALIASVIAGLAIAGGAYLFGSERLNASPLIYLLGAALLPAFTLTDVQAAAARSYGRIFTALAPKDVLWRVMIIPLGFLATMLAPPDEQLPLFLASAAITLTAIALAQGWAVRLALPTAVRHAQPAIHLRQLASVAASTWIAQIAGVVFRTLDVVIAGLFLPPKEVGLYFAASRVAGLISFVLVSTNVVVGPEVAKLHFGGEAERLRRTLRATALLVFLPSLAVFLVCTLFSHHVLRIFGDNFSEAATVLVILALGQLVNAATGGGGLVLMMTGLERKNAEVVVTSSIGAIIGMLVLTPIYGIVGTAIATSLGIIVWNVRLCLVARRQTGYDPSILGVFHR